MVLEGFECVWVNSDAIAYSPASMSNCMSCVQPSLHCEIVIIGLLQTSIQIEGHPYT